MKKKSFFDLNLPDKVFGIDSSLLSLFLLPLGLVIIFLVSLNLILIPKATEIGTINTKITSVKTDTSKINDQNKYLASIDPAQLQKDADYLNDAVLKDKESYLLVEIIRGVADKSDYQVQSFSLTPGEIKGDDSKTLEGLTKLPVSLSLIGPKEKSLDLISALEKTLPILFIDKFETRTTGDLSQLTLIVSSYYVSSDFNVDTKSVALSDLILSNDESALLKKISGFTKIENNQAGVGTTEFQQYQRDNPFSL